MLIKVLNKHEKKKDREQDKDAVSSILFNTDWNS